MIGTISILEIKFLIIIDILTLITVMHSTSWWRVNPRIFVLLLQRVFFSGKEVPLLYLQLPKIFLIKDILSEFKKCILSAITNYYKKAYCSFGRAMNLFSRFIALFICTYLIKSCVYCFLDPFEQWNRVNSLTNEERSYLHDTLEHMKGCRGVRQCTIGLQYTSNSLNNNNNNSNNHNTHIHNKRKYTLYPGISRINTYIFFCYLICCFNPKFWNVFLLKDV